MGMTTKEYHEGYQQGFKDAKKEYETRLKADMVAMLTDIQLEIEEKSWGKRLDDLDTAVDMVDVNIIIQKKINALKEQTDGTDNGT